MRHLRTTAGLVAALALVATACTPEEPQPTAPLEKRAEPEEPVDLEAATNYPELAQQIGREAVHCAHLSDDLEMCTWFAREQVTVCTFDGERNRTVEPCMQNAANRGTGVIPRAGDPEEEARRAERRAAAGQEAVEKFEAAQSLDALVELFGVGPARCTRSDAELTCAWHILQQAPGYQMAWRLANAHAMKIGLVCTFDPDEARARRTCDIRGAYTLDELMEPSPTEAS